VCGFFPRVLLDRTNETHFRSPEFRNLNSQLLPLAFSQSDFTWSTCTVDTCPPIDRWSPTTSTLQRFFARVLACHITTCLSNCWGMYQYFGVTRFFPAILLMMTRNPLVKPWFGFQDRLGKLSPVQLGSPQCLMYVDLTLQWDLTAMTLDRFLFIGRIFFPIL
jgi:hypothetical protein